MIADNLSFMILPIPALVPKDFSHSFLPLSRSQSIAQSDGCAVCDTGSNTWTPVSDTIEFLNLLGRFTLRVSAMTESSFGSLRSIKSGNGDDIASNPVVRNAFTYTGREWESEVDMFYYRARWYSPTTGRFLQSDPDPGQVRTPVTLVNKYVYVANIPIMITDLTGRNFLGDLLRVVLAVVIVAVGIFTGGTAFSAIYGAVSATATSVASSLGFSAAISSAIGTGVGALAGFAGSVGAGAAVGAMLGGVGNGLITVMDEGSFEKGFARGASIGWQLGALAGAIGAFADVGFSERAGSFGSFLFNHPWTVALPGLAAPFTNSLDLEYKCGTYFEECKK